MNEIQSLRELSKQFSILFVEDEEMVRDTMMEIFTSLFKSAVVAENGKIGLDAYNKYHDETGSYFDIVITDIIMPCMDGVVLAKNILKIHKEQTILVISACDDKKHLLDLVNIKVSGFINKPLDIKQLFSILNKLCKKLIKAQERLNFLQLDDIFTWDYKNSILYKSQTRVQLTKNEKAVFQLLSKNINQKFTNIEIFEFIYQDNESKEYSADSIKSLIKRLRKKIPPKFINSATHAGYSLHTVK